MKALFLFILLVLLLDASLICVLILAEMAVSHGKSTILDSFSILRRLTREYVSVQYIRLRRKFFA